MSHLYFNEESDYSDENTCDNEIFCSIILHHKRKLNIFTVQLPSTPCASASVRCATVAFPDDNFDESTSPVPNYASPANK